MLHRRHKVKLHKIFRLFPGYVFLQSLGPEEVARALQFSGVYGFLGQDGQPRALPKGCVEDLRAAEANGDLDVDGRRKAGDKVPIVLFDQELTAEIQSVSGRGKIQAAVTYMGRLIQLTERHIERLAV